MEAIDALCRLIEQLESTLIDIKRHGVLIRPAHDDRGKVVKVNYTDK